MNNKAMVFVGVGFELVAIVLAGIYLGGQIDAYMGWKGMAQMILILLMMVGWFVHLFVLLQKMDRDGKTPPPNP